MSQSAQIASDDQSKFYLQPSSPRPDPQEPRFFPPGCFTMPPPTTLEHAQIMALRVNYAIENSSTAVAYAEQYLSHCEAATFACFIPPAKKMSFTIGVGRATEQQREEMRVSGHAMKVPTRLLIWTYSGRRLTDGYFGTPTCTAKGCINPHHQLVLPFK